MLTGFVVMLWISINALALDKSHIPLEFSAEKCDNATIITLANVTLSHPPVNLYDSEE